MIACRLPSCYRRLSQGSDAQAAAYIQIRTSPSQVFFGAAVDQSSEIAAVKAVIGALNRSAKRPVATL